MASIYDKALKRKDYSGIVDKEKEKVKPGAGVGSEGGDLDPAATRGYLCSRVCESVDCELMYVCFHHSEGDEEEGGEGEKGEKEGGGEAEGESRRSQGGC